MLEDMLDQFFQNLNSHERGWLKQKQPAPSKSFEEFMEGPPGDAMPRSQPSHYQPECEPKTPKRHETTNQWFEIQLGDYICRFSLKWRVNIRLLLVEFMGAYTFLATLVDNHHPGKILEYIPMM